MQLAADITLGPTWADIIIVGCFVAIIIFLVQRETKNNALKMVQNAIDHLDGLFKDQESRLRVTEDAVVRLTALQETTDRRMLGLEKQAEGFVTDKQCANRHTQGRMERI